MKKYVIGVDGGGTKTLTALADLEGKILKEVRSGPSNLRNLAMEDAVLNIGEGIKKVAEGLKGEVVSCFVALAAAEEEFRQRKEEIKKALLALPGLAEILKGKLEIGSDQLAAFRSGTDEKNGLVLISGTGAVCHGWWQGKETKTAGWGTLNDEGSGFWVGQKAFEAIFKALDGRGEKTLIKDLVFEQFGVKNREGLMVKIYQSNNFARDVSLMSISVDKAAQKGDKTAKEILKEAGQELAWSAIQVIEELGLTLHQRPGRKFPLILAGKMFESEIVLEEVKKKIKKQAPQIRFIKPQQEPVAGAVKLALNPVLNNFSGLLACHEAPLPKDRRT